MVGIVLVSHSAALAEGAAELARQMAGDVAIEPAGGLDQPGRPLGTDAARVMAAIEAADHGDGVLVLMDLGSAVLSAETALDLLGPEAAADVELCDAPLVEGAVAAAVAAQAGQTLAQVAREARGGLEPKRAQLGGGDAGGAGASGAGPAAGGAGPAAGGEAGGSGEAGADTEAGRPLIAHGCQADPLPATAPASGAPASGPPSAGAPASGAPAPEAAEAGEPPLGPDAREARFVVTAAQGLHARPAANVVRAAAALDARVEIHNATTGAGPASATSLNAVATLGVREGHEITVRAGGPDAAEALARIGEIVAPADAAPQREDGAPAAGPDAAAALHGDGGDGDGDGERDASVSAGGVSAGDVDAPAGALRGTPSAGGIAIGAVRLLARPAAVAIDDREAEDPAAERAALDAALRAVGDEIAGQRARLAARTGAGAGAGADGTEILDALALMLADEALLGPAHDAIAARRQTAARAWSDAVAAVVDRYCALDDAYQRARADDVADLGRRVLERLAGRGAEQAASPAAAASPPPAPGILVARELTPLDAAALDAASVLGIATAEGGPTSHGAILARALGVPAVMGLGDAVLRVADGTSAILDGAAGLLIPEPAADVRAAYAERHERERRVAAAAAAVAHTDAVTSDGVRIVVAANIATADDAEAAVAAGADGVGLLRTEFAFLERESAPSEDEQEAIYRRAAEALDGRPLTIRTLDAGADKPLAYLAMPAEQNPFLGVRGLRLGLARPELLETQLRAILRAAAGRPGITVLFPMVATLDELRAARAILDRARAALGPAAGDVAVGAMVEIPSAALIADRLAAEVDLLSIGTNDLIQYAMAAERGNPQVAALADGLHPAVLRLIAETCRGARAHGAEVAVCGELAADPLAARLLIGLGVRELSVAPPAVAATKAAVRASDARTATSFAERALAAGSASAVRALDAPRVNRLG